MPSLRHDEAWLALLNQARGGCPNALGQLLEPYRTWLVGTADRELASDLKAKEGASDLVQQTYLEAVRGFPNFRGGNPVEFHHWLQAILNYRLIDFVRRYRLPGRRQISLELPLDLAASGVIQPEQLVARELTPRTNAVANEEAAQLVAAIARLDPDDAQILRWRNHDRLTFIEIGARLQLSPDAARKAWSRALKRLRSALLTLDAPRICDANNAGDTPRSLIPVS